MQKNNIVFLIRAYNESSRIVGVIESIFVKGFTEILVVDDGSSDGTGELLARAFDQPIHMVRHIVNRGGGAALETGFEYIRRNATKYHWDFVVTFDADGQMDITDMKNFIGAFEKDESLDIVIGSRLLEGSVIEKMPFLRRMIVLFGGRIFTRMISGNTPSDPHNGYRMLKVSLLDHIRLKMDGFEYSSELIDEIAMGGYKWCDVPVYIRYDEYTLAKGQKASNAINIALHMLYKKFFS